MIDFTLPLKDFDGNDIPDEMARAPDGSRPVLTLGRAVCHALCANTPDDRDLSGDEKFRHAELAFRIRDATDAALPAEDIALVKKKIAAVYAKPVIRAAYLLLDPAVAQGGGR